MCGLEAMSANAEEFGGLPGRRAAGDPPAGAQGVPKLDMAPTAMGAAGLC